SGCDPLRQTRFKFGIGNNYPVRMELMGIEIDRFLIEGDQNVQIIRNRPNRSGTDANLGIGVTSFNAGRKMTITIKMITQAIQRGGKDLSGAIDAFPLLSAHFPRKLLDQSTHLL